VKTILVTNALHDALRTHAQKTGRLMQAIVTDALNTELGTGFEYTETGSEVEPEKKKRKKAGRK
jgi:hypothetical protein